MALINRFSRLIRADAHAVMDVLEEPELVLRQAVRDMSDNVTAEERALTQKTREQARVERQHSALVDVMQGLQIELDDCFANDREDLARTVLRRKLETEHHMKLLAEKQVVVAQDIACAHDRLKDQKGRLESMRQKLELLDDVEPAATKASTTAMDLHIDADTIELALLREKQRRGQS